MGVDIKIDTFQYNPFPVLWSWNQWTIHLILHGPHSNCSKSWCWLTFGLPSWRDHWLYLLPNERKLCPKSFIPVSLFFSIFLCFGGGGVCVINTWSRELTCISFVADWCVLCCRRHCKYPPHILSHCGRPSKNCSRSRVSSAAWRWDPVMLWCGASEGVSLSVSPSPHWLKHGYCLVLCQHAKTHDSVGLWGHFHPARMMATERWHKRGQFQGWDPLTSVGSSLHQFYSNKWDIPSSSHCSPRAESSKVVVLLCHAILLRWTWWLYMIFLCFCCMSCFSAAID